ncbi:tachykinins [Diachasma alloeum]|uniref:tachykinins n=1 Tax=Diachasma alloeum TaxID=454923 RepID=UPI0007382EA1|nr:tachykinins [Diachasma alloeum]
MYVGLIVFVAVLIASQTLAEESKFNDVPSEKRAPMGFQGMRGKKDAENVLESDDFSKRAPMGFQGMRGKKDPAGPDLIDNIIQDDFEKRALMGFQGMRGKKDPLTLSDIKEALYHEEYDKRAPMGFQGMRGKKASEEELQFLDNIKRASMGFHGMRGKKLYADDYEDEYEKRALAMGFQGMRGKRDEYEGEWEKRAPRVFQGFQGMRGKKSFLEELEEMEKRAIMGFQGMRGKKDRLDGYYSGYVDPLDYEKRAPMGFQGMRGKKDGDKRASMGFVGMRGKRNAANIYGSDDNEFLDRLPADFLGSRFFDDEIHFVKRSGDEPVQFREKKIPNWELRGKFIGVRGKRWSPESLGSNENMMNEVLDHIERIGLNNDSTTKFDTQ